MYFLSCQIIPLLSGGGHRHGAQPSFFSFLRMILIFKSTLGQEESPSSVVAFPLVVTYRISFLFLESYFV